MGPHPLSLPLLQATLHEPPSLSGSPLLILSCFWGSLTLCASPLAGWDFLELPLLWRPPLLWSLVLLRAPLVSLPPTLGFTDSCSQPEAFESLSLPGFSGGVSNSFEPPQLSTSLCDVSLTLLYWLPMLSGTLLFLGSLTCTHRSFSLGLPLCGPPFSVPLSSFRPRPWNPTDLHSVSLSRSLALLLTGPPL